MALLTLKNAALSFGADAILDHTSLNIEAGEHIGLVGRNGSGKSTLFKVLSGLQLLDSGDIQTPQGFKVSLLQQDVPAGRDLSIYEVVAEGLGGKGLRLQQFSHISHQLGEQPELMDEMMHLQEQIEKEDGWGLDQQIHTTLSRLHLDAEKSFAELSGGMKRRVMLAQALVSEPDLLLLDEPTNHLDIDSICWLEGFIQSYPKTLMLITHDREFLQNTAQRILDLDRGQLSSWDCNYQQYLTRKAQHLEAEEEARRLHSKKLAQEEVWIRQGIKARRTRNEGRVRALEAMRKEAQAQRKQLGQASFGTQQSSLSGKIVLEASDLAYQFEDKALFSSFSTTIMRGDKIGIIGPNGVGKSTLIQLLLGRLAVQQGTVKVGTKLEPLYFDQLRDQLDEEATLIDNVTEGSDYLTINGEKKHALSYLEQFLFPPARSRTPVKALSGGERNRLLLAKLFTKPSNFLVLDEPTNDLDMETLELLESLLVEFDGTMILISHDRSFLNNTVTRCWAFEGDGAIGQYVGGYDDWLRQRSTAARTSARKVASTDKSEAETANSIEQPRQKLSYKDQRELEQLPALIEELEKTAESLQQQMAETGFYQKDQNDIADVQNKLEQNLEALTHAYQRWEELDQ